jgi:flagellar basal body-associated protein FliL
VDRGKIKAVMIIIIIIIIIQFLFAHVTAHWPIAKLEKAKKKNKNKIIQSHVRTHAEH